MTELHSVHVDHYPGQLALGAPKRPHRLSQASRILTLLEDGRWHTTAEILRVVPSIVHSRISDLRKHGYLIEHDTTGSGAEGSRYRLTGTVEL